MNWLFIAIIAYFLAALTNTSDKLVVSKTVISPAAYSFYVGLLGGLSLLLAPFGFALLPPDQIVISFLSGLLFVFSGFLFYKSIQIGEIARTAPAIGALAPVFSLTLSYLFLGEQLNLRQVISFCLLVAGGVIMFLQFDGFSRGSKRPKHKKPSWSLNKKIIIAVFSAFFFSASFVCAKFIYNHQLFINGLIWTRLGGILGALCLFLLPKTRRKIFETSRSVRPKSLSLAAVSKIISASSFFLLNYAISLGSVSLVNALQGVQYVFLFLITLFLSAKFPNLLREETDKWSVIQKVGATALIVLGLCFLAF